MSMLRHIRIHTIATGAHPSAAPSSPSTTKLHRIFSDWLRPLYAYAVPHRAPAETAAHTCRCRYPLYTFCSPTNSPFNDVASEPVVVVAEANVAALAQGEDSGSPSSSSSSKAAAPCGVQPVSPSESMPVNESKDGRGDRRETGPTLIHASMGAVGRRRSPAMKSPADAAATPPASPPPPPPPSEATPAPTTETVAAPAAPTRGRTRRRGGIFGWSTGVGDATSSLSSLPSNVIPNHAPAYRCEVCDYFQAVDEPTNAVTAPSTLADGAVRETVVAQDEPNADADVEEEEAEDEEVAENDDGWDNVPTSTDIANTIMEDTEVAQLRFQDPFLVEIIGKIGITRLANQFRKEFQAQLGRCQLSVTEIGRRVSFVPVHNKAHERNYTAWAELERQRARDARRTTPSTRPTTLTTETLDLAAYSVRFAAASYGLPFELGYFNSVSEMAKLQAEPHRRYTYATSEEQMESVRRMLQGEVPNPLLEFATSSYSITPNRACYCVVLDHKARRVVVAFRGSLTLADAICDVAEGYAQVDLANPTQAVAVGVERGALREVQSLSAVAGGAAHQTHHGHGNTKSSPSSTSSSSSCPPLARALLRPRLYQQLTTPLDKLTAPSTADGTDASATEPLLTRVPFGFYEAVTTAAHKLLPSLRSIHAQYPNYDLVLTGHSLGGIEASLFHLLFCFPTRPDTSVAPAGPLFRRVQTVTFGAAPVVEASAAARLQAMLADEERRSGSRLVHFSYGLDVISRLQVRAIVDLFQPPTAAPPETTSATATSSLVLSDAAMPTLVLPGHMFSIPHTRSRSCYPVDINAAWRRELIVTPESVFHHFPTFYVRTVNRLQRARAASGHGAHGNGRRPKDASGNAPTKATGGSG